MQNKKIILFIILVTISFSFAIFSYAAEAPKNLGDAFKIDDKSPLKQAADGAGYDTAKGEEQIDVVVASVIRALLTFLGVIFLILMIYGGFLWMTDRGNEDQVKRARNLIIAAITGLLIVLSAYAISIYIFTKISGESGGIIEEWEWNEDEQ